MKLDQKSKTGMIGPGAFIGEVPRKAARSDGGKPDNRNEILAQHPLEHKKRGKERRATGKKRRFYCSFNFVILVAVGMIVLSMCAALIVYFSNPPSAHKEGLQKTLVETLIMACMLGLGTIFGLLGATFSRDRD